LTDVSAWVDGGKDVNGRPERRFGATLSWPIYASRHAQIVRGIRALGEYVEELDI
jgi:hypothetical protein